MNNITKSNETKNNKTDIKQRNTIIIETHYKKISYQKSDSSTVK